MSDEILTPDELHDRTLAILAAAAEGRADDVDELLVTLPWHDLVTVVFGIAQLGARIFAPSVPAMFEQTQTQAADRLRALLLERQAERPGDARDGA
ncbi:hypothetical protein ACWD4Z_19255 [Streptomyces antibioticus]